MQLSDLRALLENFQRNFKEEFPILWRIKSEPAFISTIKQLLENAHTSSDRALSENEMVNLALIYDYDNGFQTTANKRAMAELKAIIGFNFIMLITEFSNRNLLAEFSPFLVTQWRHQDSIRASFVSLYVRGLCTPENLRFCFAHPGHFEEAARAIKCLDHVYPSFVTDENINAILAFINPENPDRFDGVCKVISSYYPRLGDVSNGFLFLKQLLGLNKFHTNTDIVLALHAANPELLEANIEKIQTISSSYGQELLSSIKAMSIDDLGNRRTISQEDLDYLFSQPNNLIIAAMKRGVIFSKKDPAIRSIFTNLKALSSLQATAKSIYPSLGPIVSNLLSGELSLLVTANTFEERQARQAFFIAHLDKPAALTTRATSSIVIGGSGGSSIPNPISFTPTQ